MWRELSKVIIQLFYLLQWKCVLFTNPTFDTSIHSPSSAQLVDFCIIAFFFFPFSINTSLFKFPPLIRRIMYYKFGQVCEKRIRAFESFFIVRMPKYESRKYYFGNINFLDFLLAKQITLNHFLFQLPSHLFSKDHNESLFHMNQRIR